jgi:hypothetical protein
MLQTSVPNVSYVFSDIYCKCVYLEITYVSRIWCKCFLSRCCEHVAKVFKFFQVFLQVFQTHVSNISFIFWLMLYLLRLDVSTLDRVLYLPHRLSAVLPRCQAREDGDSPHWRGRALCACVQTQQTRCGRAGAGRGMWVSMAKRAGNQGATGAHKLRETARSRFWALSGLKKGAGPDGHDQGRASQFDSAIDKERKVDQ